MASTPAERTPTVRAPLPFQPNPFQLRQMPLFEQNDVPRYLFRLHAPRTVGSTTVSKVIPPGLMCCESNEMGDIFKLQPHDAAILLNAHLRWDRWHDLECYLTSWTSSLLFVLQYGLYQHRKDWDKPDLAEIFLLILDTGQFPQGTFVKDMEIMEVFDDPHSKKDGRTLSDFLDIRKSNKGWYYFGEYLTQGELDIDGKCAQTSLQDMIDLGLFELRPDLGDKSKWNQLAERVVELRELLRLSQDDAPSATHAEVRQAITIAKECFGARWAVAVAAMLLALRPRRKNDPVIVEGFASMFTAEEIETLSLEDIKIHDDRLPEVVQFKRLINDIHRHFTGKHINLLLNPFTNLT